MSTRTRLLCVGLQVDDAHVFQRAVSGSDASKAAQYEDMTSVLYFVYDPLLS